MYDLILRGGYIVNGNRSEMYMADVCIKGEYVAKVTTQKEQAKKIIDVSGKIVCPGFIDIHSHSDASPLVDYVVESKIAQGVTTEITGNCGASCMPAVPERLNELHDYFATQVQLPLRGLRAGHLSVDDYAESVKAHGASGNFGPLIGHSVLRLAVMGFSDREPTREELEELKCLLDRELSRGAFGMSLGLIYPPSAFSTKEELTELAKVIKKHDGILSVHMRNEGPRVFEAVDEMLEIAAASGVRLQISHLKLMGKPQWGRAGELINKLMEAQKAGIRVTCDQYPFTASSTSLSALCPKWAYDGGKTELLKRLREGKEELCSAIEREMENRGGAHTILVCNTYGAQPEYEGEYISKLAEKMGVSPVEAVIRILLECEANVSSVFFCMDEQDMLTIMRQMFVCVGSDGYAFSFDPQYMKTNPHPRSYATFPGFLQLVREHNLMPLEDAIYKMTGLPAEILGMRKRGYIKEGMYADITVFDREKIGSRASYVDSKVRPDGVEYVIVNGTIAMEKGLLTQERPGRVIRADRADA